MLSSVNSICPLRRHTLSDCTTNLSCYATRDYVQALRVIAAERDTTIGKLVRAILDEALAEDLKRRGHSPLFAESVHSKGQSKRRKAAK